MPVCSFQRHFTLVIDRYIVFVQFIFFKKLIFSYLEEVRNGVVNLAFSAGQIEIPADSSCEAPRSDKAVTFALPNDDSLPKVGTVKNICPNQHRNKSSTMIKRGKLKTNLPLWY